MTGGAQLAFDLAFRPALGRDDFLVAPCNAEAVAWIDRWPDWPGPCLVIHGSEGSGKTHLAQVWRARTGAVAWSPAEEASRSDGTSAVVEDAAPGMADETLFHLYNRVAGIGGHLLVTCRTPPARWDSGLPDLLSRLRAAPTVAISPPDETLLAALLVKQFSDRRLDVPGEVILYLVNRIERSFAAARRAVARIDRAALAGRRHVTLRLVRDLLRDDAGSTS